MSKARDNVTFLSGLTALSGVDLTGAADGVAGVTSLFSSGSGVRYIPGGTIKLDTEVKPAVADIAGIIDVSTDFTGASYLNLGNIIEWQIEPIFSHDFARKEYTTDYDDFNNLFLHARHARNSTTGKPVVAYYGTAESNGTNARAFGANFTGFVTADGGRACAIEADAGYRNGATTGVANGILVVSAGAAACDVAISIQCNDAAAQWGNGINFSFNADSDEPSGNITGALIRAGSNAGVAASAERFIYATSDMSFSAAEIDLPSFRVEATPAGVYNRVSISAGATGAAPRIKAIGTDTNVPLTLQSKGTGVITFETNGVETFRITSNGGPDALQATSGTGLCGLGARGSSTNIDIALTGKGSGGVRLRDGSANVMIHCNSTGVGFFGTTPVAKPTGVAVDAAGIHAALVTLGLIAA